MLRFENVQKLYGSFLALDIPSFTINKGLTWLKGENGSGKTTLLKMIAGLHPFKGSIILNDNLTIKKQRQQFLSLVNYAEAEPLYPSFLTAQDLVKLYCHAKKGDIQQTQQLLQQLHIYDAYKKPLGAYSSGMIKKLSLALAFTGNPQLILLDEPLITIDVDAVNIICSIIQRMEEQNVSFIITSHQSVEQHQLSFNQTLLAADRTVVNIS